MSRVRAVPVVLTTVLGGLLFAPVFGLTALLVPVGAPALAVLVVALLGNRVPDWRPLLATVAGLLTIGATLLWPTTVAGLPTAATLHAVVDGVTRSWRQTLESTWPVRPETELIIFVPLLTVAAAVVALELLHRLRSPLPALLPGLALLLFAQAHVPLTTGPAVGVALGWAGLAGVLLARARAVALIPAAAGAVGAVVLAGVVVSPAGARFSFRADPPPPPVPAPLTSPLDELAGRLAQPGTPVFRFRADVVPDRWQLVVLDRFDGVEWTPGDRLRRLGARLPPVITGPVRERAATVAGAPGPWLPSQTWPAAVEGAAPYVAPGHGTLLLAGPVDYTLRWWEPQIDGAALLRSGVDDRAPGGLGPIGNAPPGLAELAARATGGQRSSFRAALRLEAWFRAEYRLATGDDLPTGHSWPQLAEFLRTTRRGTSEQVAAAYVVLARMAGIPARLAVGYRTPARPDADGAYTVRNGDALAWPEVAVPGAGWIPLDPTGQASAAGVRATGPAAAAQQARSARPGRPGAAPPAPAAAPVPAAARPRHRSPWWALVPGVLLAWPVVVPLLWAARAGLRRRRRGADGVLAAAGEARDRLLAYGLTVSPAMTLRDLACGIPEPATAALRRLGAVADRAAWSGDGVRRADLAEAWSSVRALRRGLAERGPRARLLAAVSLRGLSATRHRHRPDPPAGTAGVGQPRDRAPS
ncbi:transglutaminase domain-containing protein [Actinoplanes sp. M2I2]|uniref:transglutaminase domain-containing protein n=1 Tax=Actinoplanes sp. M2I2 TaxID=1734444 RepID=UPI0020204316|nr:transglutaminase domain-containing protein [Actinoplanes sp. M2I2]